MLFHVTFVCEFCFKITCKEGYNSMINAKLNISQSTGGKLTRYRSLHKLLWRLKLPGPQADVSVM